MSFINTFAANDNPKLILKNIFFPLTFPFKSEARAIIGYRAFPNFAHLLIATKVRSDLQLFGGHEVFTIEERQWIKIPLSHYQSISRSELKNLELVCDFPLEGVSYYCETLDLTRPFPSTHDVMDFDPEFRWNSFWSQAFEECGFPQACVVLLQGLAIGRNVASVVPDSKPGLSLFCRLIYLIVK